MMGRSGENERLLGLEPDAVQMRAFAERAVDHVVRHLASLDGQRAVDLDGAAEKAALVREPLPWHPSDYEELFRHLFDEVIPKSINTASPGMLSYVQGGGLFHAAVADFVSLAVNRFVGYAAAAPVLAELEANVVRWFCEILGFPAGAGGVLTSGGSVGHLIAVVAARSKHLGDDLRGARVYASDQLHHSIEKAALVAGLPRDAVRPVATDARYRIELSALDRALREDRANGRRPFLLVGTGGTTNTGAIDDLTALRGLADREGLWLHVDGAYGGFFRLTERGRIALRGIEAADSVVVDPHKSLFLPYGTGALLTRHVDALRHAHELHSDYVHAVRAEGASVDFASISPELSRDCRGLRVWLPMKMVGAQAFRDALDEKLDLASYAADQLRAIRCIELADEPQLSTVAFHLRGVGEAANDATERVLERVNGGGRVHLSGTVLRGRAAIRVCVLSFRVHRRAIDACLEDLKDALAHEKLDVS